MEKRKLYLLLTMLICAGESIALAFQSDPVRFSHLTPDDGLSARYVGAILQDRQGFLWFGTPDGLNKYDGYTFTIYRNSLEDPNSVSDSGINALCEDHAGFLWIGTAKGLNSFDPRTERFVRYMYDEGNPHSVSGERIRDILEDHTGTLWVATLSGLNRFDRTTATFQRFLHSGNEPGSLSGNQVWTLYEDRQHALWVGTSNGLNRFDPITGTFTRYQHDASDPDSLSHNEVRAIAEDHDGTLWIGTFGGGVNRFDRETETFTHFRHEPDNPHSLSSDMVSFIHEDATGALWIGTQGGGVNQFDPERGRWHRYLPETGNPDSISDSGVLSVLEDRSGILWIGTSSSGVTLLDRQAQKFTLYRHNPADPDSLSSNNVLALHEDRQGQIWVGMADNGLDRFDPRTGTFTHYPPDPNAPERLGHPVVFHIEEDHAGDLWLGTWGGGLYRFEPDTERFTSYQHDPANPHSISHNIVTFPIEDRFRRIWAGTWGGGLNRFVPGTGRFFHYRYDENDPGSISEDRLLVLYEDHTDALWIGTVGGGLDRFEPETDTFTHYRHKEDDPRSLSNNVIHSLHEDRSGTLWVGTPNGLNRFDRETASFTTYLAQDGLPNAYITCILEDRHGGLWLSTNQGLSHFDPRSETFRNYDTIDGLQGNVFAIKSCAASRTGALLFGGTNGLNIFQPEQVSDNSFIPPVVLTALRLDNTPVVVGGDSPLQTSITFANELVLPPEHAKFEIEFAALNYTHPSRNQYAYMLEGFDADWIRTDSTQRFARYTNLDPGQYTFRVKASNNDGVWNETGTTLPIVLLPSWYETWTFRGFFTLVLAGLVFGGYRWRVRSLEAHSQELEQLVMERTAALRERENRLQTIFDTSQAGIILVDPHGIITFANQCMADLFKCPLSEVIGSTYPEHIHPQEQEIGDQRMRRLIDGEIDSVSIERHYRCADGSDFWGLINGRRMLDESGQLVSLVGIITDITERRHAVEALHEAKNAAEAASQAKSVFLANMSHELRTPLNGILGYAQILKRRQDLDTTQRDGLQVIYTSGQHLLTLINDILALTKIESGKMELYPEPVNLATFLEGVVGVMRMSAHHKHIRFVYDAAPNLPVSVACDQKRLRQVLLNLLGNAVKFTESGGTVTFTVTQLREPTPNPSQEGNWAASPQENSPLEGGRGVFFPSWEGPGVGSQFSIVTLQFSIKDTGVGMTPEQMQTIFAPFEQVGDVKKRAEGTGLGLTITRQLVKLMGGDIRVESEPGRGSTFSFEIPVPVSLHDAQPGPRHSEHRHIIGYAGDAHTLLVVDALPENRMVLLNLLAPLGFQILLAEDGQQGLEQANAHHPDLILTDLVMPVMDGFEMVKRIRDAAALRDVPIIAISASTYDSDKETSLDIGCQAFLSKPIDEDRLYALIAEHVGITWVYDMPEAPPDVNDTTPSTEPDIIPPPQEALEELYELTMFGNLERVREKADAIARQDAHYGAFARQIRIYAEKLEDEPILELLIRYITQQ